MLGVLGVREGLGFCRGKALFPLVPMGSPRPCVWDVIQETEWGRAQD